MPQVRVREKHQVTLPVSIIREAKISENDLLDVSYSNGVITLMVHKIQGPKRSLMDYVGISKGIYGTTAKEVDAYIDAERNSWER